jgi:hypothetical protein
MTAPLAPAILWADNARFQLLRIATLLFGKKLL